MSGTQHIVNMPDDALRDAIAAAGLDNLDGAFAFRDGDDLHKPNLGTRRRTRVVLRDAAGRECQLFLKRYGPEPFLRRLRRCVFSLASLSWMKSPARVEFDAIAATRAAGVPTMDALALGQSCPLTDGRSFLLVSTVPGQSLERQHNAFATDTAHTHSTLAPALADLVRTFHAAGLVHRDLYTSHIFLSHSDGTQQGDAFELHLIDLARVFRPVAWRRFRWQVKDLAALHFSLPPKWVANHWQDFLIGYLGETTVRQMARWTKAIEKKSNKMARRAARKNA